MYVMIPKRNLRADKRAALARWSDNWGGERDASRMAGVWVNDGPFLRINENTYGHGTFQLMENNPVGRDSNGCLIYAYTSILQVPKGYFSNPVFSVLLPPFSRSIAIAARSAAMPILLKQSVVERNTQEAHTEIAGAANAKFLDDVIYHAEYVLHDRPSAKPRYYVCAKLGKYIQRVTLDFIREERRIEVVDWYSVSPQYFTQVLNSTVREGGFIGVV